MAEKKHEVISWRAAEYEYTEKGPLWFLGVSGVAVILIVISIFQGNPFFGLFIFIATLLIISFGRKRPRIFEYEIDKDGIRVEDKIKILFSDIENFSVKEGEGHLNEIFFKKKTVVNPIVRFPIDGKLCKEAEEFLSDKIEQVEHRESLIDIFSEWFRI